MWPLVLRKGSGARLPDVVRVAFALLTVQIGALSLQGDFSLSPASGSLERLDGHLSGRAVFCEANVYKKEGPRLGGLLSCVLLCLATLGSGIEHGEKACELFVAQA